MGLHYVPAHPLISLEACLFAEGQSLFIPCLLGNRTVSFLISTNALSEVHILCSMWNGRVNSWPLANLQEPVLLINQITWTTALAPSQGAGQACIC